MSDLKNICLTVGTDTSSQMDRHDLHMKNSSFFNCKEHLKMNIKYHTGSQTNLSVSLALFPSNQQGQSNTVCMHLGLHAYTQFSQSAFDFFDGTMKRSSTV
jgi:hypothetical protein